MSNNKTETWTKEQFREYQRTGRISISKKGKIKKEELLPEYEDHLNKASKKLIKEYILPVRPKPKPQEQRGAVPPKLPKPVKPRPTDDK